MDFGRITLLIAEVPFVPADVIPGWSAQNSTQNTISGWAGNEGGGGDPHFKLKKSQCECN
jgi:hypothetical protein